MRKEGRKSMKKKTKVLAMLLLAMFILFFLVPLVVNILFYIKAPYKIFAVFESAQDALGYLAGSAAFIGTMFLGWVAWKQNSDLKNIEKSNLIAANSCMVLISSLKLTGWNSKFNPPNCTEQIVKTDFPVKDIYDFKYASFACELSIKSFEKHPALVRVTSLTLSFSGDKDSLTLFCKNYDNTYSRIAFSEQVDKFNIIIFVEGQEKERAKQLIKGKNGKVLIDAKIDLVSDNLVATYIKCTATLKKEPSDKISELELSDQNPMCSWYGNSLLEEKEISFRRGET